MKNPPNPQPKDLPASKLITLAGSWKSMILPFIGVLIVNTAVAIWGGSFILMKMFGGRFETKGEAMLVMVILAVLVVFAWVMAYVTHFHQKWKTKVVIDLEKELVTLHSPKGETKCHFSTIANIRYKAATSLFGTTYLYFITKVREKEEPLIAISHKTWSHGLYMMLRKRTKLNLIQNN